MILFASDRQNQPTCWFSLTLTAVSVITFVFNWSCYSAPAQEPRRSADLLSVFGTADGEIRKERIL